VTINRISPGIDSITSAFLFLPKKIKEDSVDGFSDPNRVLKFPYLPLVIKVKYPMARD